MASRMSNRDRIQRMAQEADAAKKEKAEKAKVAPKTTAKTKAKAKTKTKTKAKAKAKTGAAVKKKATRKSAKKGRVKIVWAVSVPAGRTLKVFPYREKAEAEAEAARLTEKKGTLHMVRSERAPMEDDE